jgi:hypothetical protein
MQVRTPARQPGPRVGLDDVPSRYEAKQAGLDRTLLAAYTGSHRRHTRDMPLGSRGHYGVKSTVSAALRLRRELRRQAGEAEAAKVTDKAGGYSEVCAMGPADGELAGSAATGAAGTAASDLMSMRQPVSLAASLAFCPSLPIASDNW